MAEETITLTKRDTDRQVRTLLGRVRAEGAKGIIHRSRESPRKMPKALEDRIARIIGSKYPDFSPLHASEKLAERHRIKVSREKLRQVMMDKGLWKRRRQRKEAHLWRERKHRLGEMVQMDGSHHDWLEGRGRSGRGRASSAPRHCSSTTSGTTRSACAASTGGGPSWSGDTAGSWRKRSRSTARWRGNSPGCPTCRSTPNGSRRCGP